MRLNTEYPVDNLSAEISKVPINTGPLYMLLPEKYGFYCYEIRIYGISRRGPPITSSCYSWDSVQPSEKEIKAIWLDKRILRVTFDNLAAIEVSLGLRGVREWKKYRSN